MFDAALDGVNGLNFQLQKSDAAGRFEWSDGFLVDALQVLTVFFWLIICTISSSCFAHNMLDHKCSLCFSVRTLGSV